MPALLELQRTFAAALLQEDASAIHTSLYIQTVRGTLSKALEGIYPVLRRLLGERCFSGLARRYIRVTPSRSGDLHEFGGEMSAWIASTPLDGEYPYLSHMAQLEWTVHQVFHAADSSPMALDALRRLSPTDIPAMRFCQAPACALLRAPFPVHRLWQANQDGQDGICELNQENTHLLVVRGTEGIEMIPLNLEDFAFIAALASGVTLASAVAAAMRVRGSFKPDAVLGLAVTRGAILPLMGAE